MKKRMKFRKVAKPVAYFTEYSCPEDYQEAECVWCEPMLAQELKEQDQDKYFNNPNVYVEEKFDGTRAILQFFDNRELELDCLPSTVKGFTRCFSRRVSKKTDWFSENTDSLPHLRDLNFPELAGTIIDGEMFIDGRPFKDVSSTLNCLWDEAVKRQKKLGKVVFHTFDIVYYKGKSVEDCTLEKRKELLHEVVSTINSPYIVEVPYYSTDDITIRIDGRMYKKLSMNRKQYPNLWDSVQKMPLHEPSLKDDMWAKYKISKKAYYEYIVFNGGEGVILKPKDGLYTHKRGKEYLKVKKFLTREVIITGFLPPTKEYTGIFPKDRWLYWLDEKGRKIDLNKTSDYSAKALKKAGYTPVTKFFYYDQIGTIEYGVLLLPDEHYKVKKIDELETKRIQGYGDKCVYSLDVLVVGDCGGITDEEREYFTENRDKMIGKVIEIKANDIFEDTGKLRHPRYLRLREDKNASDCTWDNHIM